MFYSISSPLGGSGSLPEGPSGQGRKRVAEPNGPGKRVKQIAEEALLETSSSLASHNSQAAKPAASIAKRGAKRGVGDDMPVSSAKLKAPLNNAPEQIDIDTLVDSFSSLCQTSVEKKLDYPGVSAEFIDISSDWGRPDISEDELRLMFGMGRKMTFMSVTPHSFFIKFSLCRDPSGEISLAGELKANDAYIKSYFEEYGIFLKSEEVSFGSFMTNDPDKLVRLFRILVENNKFSEGDYHELQRIIEESCSIADHMDYLSEIKPYEPQ